MSMAQQLTLREFIEKSNFAIDSDIFTLLWDIIEGKQWITLNKEIIVSYLSASGRDVRHTLPDFYRMLYTTYQDGVDYKEIEPPAQVLKGRPQKCFAVTKKTLVTILCRTKNPISMRILEYFYTLQELVVKYYKNQVADHEKSIVGLLELPAIVEHTAKQAAKHTVIATESRAGFIYFIHEVEDMTHFKIGFTHDVPHRIVQLQIGNRRELVCYRTVATTDMVSDELYLHKRYNVARRKGEWFELSMVEVDVACAWIADRNKNVELLEPDLDTLLAELGLIND